MPQFLTGFIFTLAAAGILVVILYFRRISTTKVSQEKQGDEVRQLGRLAGELAHEIKNPLSTIKVNLKLVSEDLADVDFTSNSKAASESNQMLFARANRKIGVIQKETDRLEHILDGFLQYVRGTELELHPADINQIVSNMIDFYSPQAYSHKITIRHLLYSSPLICKIDENMLKQTLLNLFINAQQAMIEGGELMIRTEKTSKQALIQVSDTGCGIEPERLDLIFEASYSSRPKGSGLGLATAKRIIEDLNGTITVNSEPGKGTSFTIALPLGQK